MLHLADGYAELFAGFSTDRELRGIAVEKPGRSFDEHAVGVVVDVGREPELASQQHGSAHRVIDENGCAVAAIVGFTLLRDLSAVSLAIGECGAPQNVPSLRSHLDLAHLDVRVAVQPKADAVEAGTATTVGNVDSGALR